MHNDYVTGGFALARAAGAAYLVNADDPVSFDRTPVSDGDLRGDRRDAAPGPGDPGHTYSHLAYVVEAGDGAAGGEIAGVFTGGSLLYGSTGRTDLLGPDATAGAHPRAVGLGPAAGPGTARHRPDLPHPRLRQLLLGHAVARPPRPPSGTRSWSTRCSPWTRAPTWNRCWPGWTHGPPITPTWPRLNLAGPAGPTCHRRARPMPPSFAYSASRRASGWSICVTGSPSRLSHVPGTFSFPLDNRFATYLGWMIPWGTPLTLLGDSRSRSPRPSGSWPGSGSTGPLPPPPGGLRPGRASGASPRCGWPSSGTWPPPSVPGTAGRSCWTSAADWSGRRNHIAGAVHIPLHELPGRAAELPPGEVWVHCESGYRSVRWPRPSLAARGQRVVSVDDDFASAAAAGLSLEQA